MTPECLEFRATYPKDWQVAYMLVDTDGNPLPWHAAYRQRDARHAGWTIRQHVNHNWAADVEFTGYRIWAAGVRDPELERQHSEEGWPYTASRYPVVPGWLGEHLPLHTVFVPNGDILTYGPLGLNAVDADGKPTDNRPGESWYRYDRAGRLLGVHQLPLDRSRAYTWPPLPDWRLIYNSNIAQVLESQPVMSRFTDSVSGYTVIIDTAGLPENWWSSSEPRNHNIKAVYEYDGSYVLPDTVVNAARFGTCQVQNRMWLEKVYRHQLAAGLTTAEPSSYAGTPEGPVVVDGAPRKPPLLAHRRAPNNAQVILPDGSISWGGEEVQVRPLDDPANPYRSEYREWDHWAVANAGRQDPKMQAHMQEQNRLLDEWFKRQDAAGEPHSIAGFNYKPYIPAPGEHWRTVGVQVDAQGYALPLTQRWQSEAQMLQTPRDIFSPRQPDSSNYFYSAGGEPSADLAAAWDAAFWDIVGPAYPQVPEWLGRSGGVFYAVFVPNGEVVTLGAPGDRPAGLPVAILHDYDSLPGLELAWHRYSAAGELLGRLPVPDRRQWPMWLELYWPGAAALRESYRERKDVTVYDDAGYLLIRERDERGGFGPVLEVYRYDGTPVAVEQPLMGMPLEGTLISGEQLEELWRWQQGEL
jgi:hypothetical protein